MKLGRKILLMLLAIFATTVVAAGIYLTTTYNSPQANCQNVWGF